MAVDFWHRLLVEGPPADVRAFRRDLWREFPRTLGRKTWTEVVPFSFEALYALAPGARRIFPRPPCDPFDLSAWPVRRLGPGVAEVRYRFHTRSLEMQDLLLALSQALPTLVFTLATLCLDTAEIDAYRFRAGKTWHWSVPGRVYRAYTKRERAKLKGVGEEVDFEAEEAAERVLLDVGLGRWRRRGPVRRLRWWGQETFRDLEVERDLFMAELDDPSRARRDALLTRRSGDRLQNAPHDLLVFDGEVYWPRRRPTDDQVGPPPERPVEKRPRRLRRKRRR